MRRSRKPIVIVSRRSTLARAQAQAVGGALAKLNPGIEVEYRWIESQGDQRTDVPLAASGGKGLFAKAIERALLRRQADIAVHSLKDLPVELTPGLTIAAVPRRGEVRDCLITRPGIDAVDIASLPQGARVGTASPRRSAQLLRLRPDLRIELIRGNVETRLQRVIADGAFDATLLAAVGLQRAGFGEHANKLLDPQAMLPAASQGALAVQCRADDHGSLTRCIPLNDPAASTAVHIERQIVAALAGDCHSAIGALAEPADQHVRLRVRVLRADGVECIDLDERFPASKASKAVRAAAQALDDQGAARLLAARPN